MEFTPELITELGLSTEQVEKINTFAETHIADLKKEWDGKANLDAERILDGAVTLAKNKMGLQGVDFDRKTGEKYADYLSRTTPVFIDSALMKEKQELQSQKSELERKIKDGNISESVKQELDQVKQQLDQYKQKDAKFADWEANDYKGKYEQTLESMTKMEQNVAFSNVRPAFPDTVNPYEAKAKWNEFQQMVKDKYTIKLDENNEPIAVEKENQYKTVKLADLVKADKTLSELVKGRQATGLGSQGRKNESIEGIPFAVPEGVTSEERSKLIKEYLTGTLKLSITSPEYSKQFAELNIKLMGKTPQK
jgi:hypothetical protein